MPSEESTAGADRHLGRVVDELKRELEAKSRELAEAREQQVATAGILEAISSSPADLQRVCAEIAANAARLCDAYDALIFQVDGDCLRLVAHNGAIPAGRIGQYTLSLTRGRLTGRAVLDLRTIHIADLLAETDEYPEGSGRARSLGFRTTLAVPMIRAGEAIGVVLIRRTEVRPFTDRQIELLKTFADQAVIAIENTRLFEAEQARTRELSERTRELSESLDYQTATSDVLAAIAHSRNDLRPVLETLAETALRLCSAYDVTILMLEGDWLVVGANKGPVGGGGERRFPVRRGTAMGRAIFDRKTVHIPDLRSVELEFPEGYASSMQLGHRTIVAVPL